MEGFIVEFLLHLFCTSFVFRADTVKHYKSPGEIAKVAARAMTIFKHYTETRGSKVLLLDEYQKYKMLHKIAFPPTHPSFAHLFKHEWIDSTRNRIVTFLHQFYEIDVSVPPPPLLQMFLDRQQQIKDVKATFKKRERKLMQFARSIYDISAELVEKLEEEIAKSSLDNMMEVEKSLDDEDVATAARSVQYIAEVKAKLADYQSVLDPSGGTRSRDRSRDPSPDKSIIHGQGQESETESESKLEQELPLPSEPKKETSNDALSSSRQGSRGRSRVTSAVAKAREEEAAEPLVKDPAANELAIQQLVNIDVVPLPPAVSTDVVGDNSIGNQGSSAAAETVPVVTDTNANADDDSGVDVSSEKPAPGNKKMGVLPPVSSSEMGIDLGLCITGSSKPNTKPGTGSGSSASGSNSRPISGADGKPPQILSF